MTTISSLLKLFTRTTSIIVFGYIALNALLISLTDTVWGQLTGFPAIAQFSLLVYATLIIIRAYGWHHLRFERPLPLRNLRAEWFRWLAITPVVALFAGVPLYVQATEIGLPSLALTGSLVGTVLMLLAAALHSELIFRGVLAGALVRNFNPIIAALLSGVAFGMTQGYLTWLQRGNWLMAADSLLAFSALGVLLGGVYLFTRALWLSYALHAGTLIFMGLTRLGPDAFDTFDGVQAAFNETLLLLLPFYAYLLLVMLRDKRIKDDFGLTKHTDL